MINLVDSDASWEWLSNKMNGEASEFPTTKELLEFRIQTGITDRPYLYGFGFISDLSLDASAGDEFATFSGTVSVSGSLQIWSVNSGVFNYNSRWNFEEENQSEGYPKGKIILLPGGEIEIPFIDSDGFSCKDYLNSVVGAGSGSDLRINVTDYDADETDWYDVSFLSVSPLGYKFVINDADITYSNSGYCRIELVEI